MIIYKIKKLIPYYKNRYLSTLFEENKPVSLKKREGKLKFYIKNYGLLILGGPLIFLVLFLFFSLINFNIDWTKATTDFFSSTLTIPLSFVSVIIPIVTLAISDIKDIVPDSFKKIYFGNLDPRIVFLINIFYLAIFIFLFLFSFYLGLKQFNSKILIILGLTSLIFPIIMISFFIRRAMTLVMDEIPYIPIVKQMKTEIKEIVNFEIYNNIFRYIFIRKCEELNLVFDPNFSSFDYKELFSNKVGTLIDIDLYKLKSFVNSIEMGVEYRGENFKGVISIVPVRYTKKLETVGYINKENLAETNLSDALIIAEKLKVAEKDLISFKNLAYRAITDNQETEFKRIIDVYIDGLDYFMNYMNKIGVKSTPSELYGFFSKWRFLRLVGYDFYDIAKLAAESSNDDFIDTLSFRLCDLFISAMKYEDFSVFKLLDIFNYSLYYYSFENHNVVGVDRSVTYLSDVIGNAENILKNPYIRVREFENTCEFLFYSINILIDILKQSIDNNDFKTFENALNRLSKILSHYNPDNLKLHERKMELNINLKKLENSSEASKEIEDELSLIDTIQTRKIANEIKNEIFIQKIEASSYIVKKINSGRFNGFTYKKYIELLSNNINNYKALVNFLNLIHERENGELNFKLKKDLWERDDYPKTDGFFVIDTMGGILLFFSLIGISSVNKFDDYRYLNSSKTIKIDYNQIKSISETIKTEEIKWIWLIDSNMDSKIDKFLEECEKSTKIDQN